MATAWSDTGLTIFYPVNSKVWVPVSSHWGLSEGEDSEENQASPSTTQDFEGVGHNEVVFRYLIPYIYIYTIYIYIYITHLNGGSEDQPSVVCGRRQL